MFSILQILALNQQKHASKETNSFSTISLHSFCFYKKVVFQIEAQTSYFFRILRLKTLPASYFIGIWGLTFLFFFNPEVQCWGMVRQWGIFHYQLWIPTFESWQVKQKPKCKLYFSVLEFPYQEIEAQASFFFLNSGSATFLRTSWFFQILRLAFL